MKGSYLLSAICAVLLNVTACSQTRIDIFDFMHAGVKYVAIRADDWDTMVAKRLGSNELNRDRLHTVHLMRRDLIDEGKKKESYMKDADDAKAREHVALGMLSDCTDHNTELQRNVKKLRPWAMFGKVTVVVGVVGVTIAGVELVKNSIQ